MFFFHILRVQNCENDKHVLNDRIGAVVSFAVSCCLTLFLHDAAWVKETHIPPLLTIEFPVALWLEHLTRSWRVLGLIPIWGLDFSEFPEGPIVIWFNILRDPWKVFSHKHSTFWQQVATTLLLKLFTNISNQQWRHYRCSMLLAVGTCAMVSWTTRAVIGRKITNHSLEKKKARSFDLFGSKAIFCPMFLLWKCIILY